MDESDLRRRLDRLNARKLGFDDRAFAEQVAAYAAEEPDICAYALAVLLLLTDEREP